MEELHPALAHLGQPFTRRVELPDGSHVDCGPEEEEEEEEEVTQGESPMASEDKK